MLFYNQKHISKEEQLSIMNDFGKWVTFFLKLRLDYNIDRHLRPVWPMCLPCHFKYDCIIKTETAQGKSFARLIYIYSNDFSIWKFRRHVLLKNTHRNEKTNEI